MHALLDAVTVGGESVATVAEVLATYGVYGLVVFVALVWQLVGSREKEADSPSAKLHYRKQGAWCLGFLAAVVVAAGILAFMHQVPRQPWVRGAFAELRKGTHQIRLVRDEHFTREIRGEHDEYKLDWITPPGDNMIVRLLIAAEKSAEVAPDKDPKNPAGGTTRLTSLQRTTLCQGELPLNIDDAVFFYDPRAAPPCGEFVSQHKSATHIKLENLDQPSAVKNKSAGSGLIEGLNIRLIERAYAQSEEAEPAHAPSSGDHVGAAATKLTEMLGHADFDEQQLGLALLEKRGDQALPTVDAITTGLRDARSQVRSKTPHPELVVQNLRRFLDGRAAPEHASSPERIAALAQVAYWADDYATACELFARAQVSSQESSELGWQAWYQWGVALRQIGRIEEAPSKFEAALNRATDPCDRSSIVASRAYTLGKTPVATDDERSQLRAAKIKQYEEAVALCPNNSRANNNLAWNLAQQDDRGQLVRALSLVERALKEKPTDPDYLDTQGTILCKLGKQEEGIKALDLAISLHPRHDPMYDVRLSDCRSGAPLRMGAAAP